MQYRSLGSSGLKLSVIGLGTWAIGGGDWKFGWGDQDEQEAIDTIVRAVELGINWIDTAAIYGEGRSEVLVAKAMQQIPVPERPLLATKCGRVALGNGEIGKCLRRDSIIRECEDSLKRLQMDCIDLYQLHWPEPDEEIEEGWQTLVDLKAQGKVRHIGVSNHSVNQMQRLQAIHPVVSLQPPYSMIARDIETEILPFCAAQNVGVICYSPMGKGLLTGAFSAARVAGLSASDHRTKDPRFLSPQLEINLTFVEALGKIATGLGWTIPELSIAWVLASAGNDVCDCGFTANPRRLLRQSQRAIEFWMRPAIGAIEAALQQRDNSLLEAGTIVKPRV
jgi:aryl-alcohol dehydrogenase-like predicted oxidoreductase